MEGNAVTIMVALSEVRNVSMESVSSVARSCELVIQCRDPGWTSLPPLMSEVSAVGRLCRNEEGVWVLRPSG